MDRATPSTIAHEDSPAPAAPEAQWPRPATPTGGIAAQEAAELLRVQGDELAELLTRANAVREAHFGRRATLCAISNAKSGACRERCDYCAQSVHFSAQSPIFPLKSATTLLGEARAAEAGGATSFSLVTSGRTIKRESELSTLKAATEAIQAQTRLRSCASLGLLTADTLRALKDAGLERYHHNVETAPSFHPHIVHTHSFADEVAVVVQAQKLGLSVCSGGILGMGESLAQRVELAMALRDLGPDCVPMNFLDPRPGTPLSHLAPLSPDDALRALAVFRLVLPTTSILVCGGRALVLGAEQRRMFCAGATGVMTGDYLTTQGEAGASDRRLVAEAGLCLTLDVLP